MRRARRLAFWLCLGLVTLTSSAELAAQEPEKVAVMVRTATGHDEQRWFTPGAGKMESFRDCMNASCGGSPEMVVVPAGRFTMGAPETDELRNDDEGPQREVTIARAFAVGKFEVSFAEWDACVTDGGCKDKLAISLRRGKLPARGIGWIQITNEYIPWLQKKTGKNYRLLSEAEWEYVARARTKTPYSFAGDRDNLGDYAWFSENSDELPHAVGEKQPNAWGLYDVHGNVWEWTEDCYRNSYNDAPKDGSAWKSDGCKLRVLRGGSWRVAYWALRSTSRYMYFSDLGYVDLGFRVARTL